MELGKIVAGFVSGVVIGLAYDEIVTRRRRKKYEKIEFEKLPKQYGTNRKCGQCGSKLVFDRTDNKGTTVKICPNRFPNSHIIRNAIMPFLWVYFKCEKCGWILCTTHKSNDVFVVKSDDKRKKK